MSDDALFARPRNPDASSSELRVANVPRELLEVLDARAIADNEDRGQLVIRVLRMWCRQEARRHIVLQRVMGANPALLELSGLDAE